MTAWKQRAAFWLALAALAFSTALLFSGWGDPPVGFGEGPWRCTVVDRDDVGRGQVFDCKGRGG